MLIGSFERYPLLFGPSPVHPLDRLSAHLGGASVWAKREDCNSGIAYGGNKTRKLEYLVADALAKGCDTLVSIGGVQSNHTRQVAAVAARVGLNCVLIQESWVNWPDAVYDKVGNILISRLAGADVRLVPAGFGIGFKQSWEQALREIEESGGRPYAIPAGASDHPLGGLGFAGWAFEVAEQERELGVFFDTIVVCSVTGSTQAGIVAGFAALAASAAGRAVSSASMRQPSLPKPATRSPGSHVTPPGSSASSVSWAMKRSSWTSATTRARTASPTTPPWMRCGSPPAPKA